MKKVLLIKVAVMLLLFTFVSGQLVFAFHEHHHATHHQSSGEPSKKQNDDCSICQLNAHPALFSLSHVLLVVLFTSSYRYLVKNLVFNHQAYIHRTCVRGPPAATKSLSVI